jgi:hypothetical protein
VKVGGPNPFGASLSPPSPFGFVDGDLNHMLASGDPFPGVGQAWVTTVMKAGGKYSVGYKATQLDNASRPNGSFGAVLIQ